MTVLVVGPHPDDELLGCGGTILRWLAEGSRVSWCLVTARSAEDSEAPIQDVQVSQVVSSLGIAMEDFHWLRYESASLDLTLMKGLVSDLAHVLTVVMPHTVLIPHCGDVHSDHRLVHQAILAASKWFRSPSIQRILAYETLSETEQGLNSDLAFSPNVYIDISRFLAKKIELLKIYSQELGRFPFPRSDLAVDALAKFRGTSVGFEAAEAFVLLRERQPLDDAGATLGHW